MDSNVNTPVHATSLHSVTIDSAPVITTKPASAPQPMSASQFSETHPTGHSGVYTDSSMFSGTSPTGNASAGISHAPAHSQSTAGSTGANVSNAASNTADNARASVNNAADDARATANNAADNARATASNAADNTRASVNNAADNVRATANNAADSARASVNNAANSPAVTGLRERVNSLGTQVNSSVSNLGNQVNSSVHNIGNQLNHAAEHPVVQDAKAGAVKQVDHLREYLGQSPLLVRAEKRFNVDRVVLVGAGIAAYILLIPLNFLHLALFTTDLLTFIPPLLLSARVLEHPNEQRTKLLLSYFTVFGFVQLVESWAAGLLEKTIPQYYTVKLLFLAYLIHPQTKGAYKIHESVLRPLFATRSAVPASTPPSSHPFSSSANSPTHQSSGFSTAGTTSTSSAAYSTGFSTGVQPNATAISNTGTGSVQLPSGGGTGLGGQAPARPLAGTSVGQL